jgi:2-polyprenyl-6-methoxyphenol hydroxylase-like FAD-dependent oxidoreductase
MILGFDVCVRGAGVVGHAVALLLAQERLRVALVDADLTRPTTAPDVRAYALNQRSRALLQSLRAWPPAELATPVQRMDVRGDAGGAIGFEAAALGEEALAWIVDAAALLEQLKLAAGFSAFITRVAEPAKAGLQVITEGRISQTRQALGVAFDAQPYLQHGVAARLGTDQAHRGVAHQWFHQGEVVALLPTGGEGGRSYALVWSMASDQAAPRLAASSDEFLADLSRITHQVGASAASNVGAAMPLGHLTLQSERSAWPLQQAQADRWCGTEDGQPWVLAGDAAHSVHPLAGQGLNLGLADAQCLARVLRTRDYWRNVGDLRLLRAYERERKAQLLPLALGMDGLQRLFAHPAPLLGRLRNWGMQRADQVGAFKRWAARQAMGTVGADGTASHPSPSEEAKGTPQEQRASTTHPG